jgi:hypothetical protein
MTDHHHNPIDLEDVAQPPRASTALAPIADAIARASVTLDRIAADLEAVGTQLGGLEEPHQTEGQRATLLAKAAAWDAMHEALTRNAHGESHASAADVCAVGFAQQEALATHGHHGDVYEPDGPNAVRRVGLDGQRRSLVHMVRHSPTGLNWGYGGSGPADLARSLLLDALGHHDDVADPDGVKDAVEGLYQQFCDDVVAALPKRGWRVEVARVRAWAAAQVPELADTIVAAGRSR